MQRQAHVVIAGCLASLAAAEWLRGDAAVWAALAGVAGLTALVLTLRTPMLRQPITIGAGLAGVMLGALLVRGAVRVWRIECCWPALREHAVPGTSRALQKSLGEAIAQARQLAERGSISALLPRDAVFDRLEHAAASSFPIEHSVAVVDESPDANPIAWAGRHRVIPELGTTELQAVMTPFYALLEARRQTQRGTAVGSVLLSAAPAVADGDHSLGAAFARAHDVSLRFFPAGQGPRDSSVFEICAPPSGCAGGDTLFSVLTIPPSQGDAKLRALEQTTRLARIAMGVMLLLLLGAATPGAWRWGVVLVAAWVLFRAPVGPSSFFTPATFYRPVAGLLGTSAGSLFVAGVLLLLGAAWLWRRGLPRRWWGTAAAALLILAAPYLVRYFGRGIAPPASGVSLGLWLSWQAALAVTAMALILLAAALVRGAKEPARVPWALPAACVWGALATIGGLWLWSPHGAWPEWYTFLWLPALAGVIVPAPRRWALVGMAIVGGTAAALVTWGAAVEGRLSLASRDALRLGKEGDAVAVALLERFGQEVAAPSHPPPGSASELYALWVGSPLIGQDYPATLALWEGGDARLGQRGRPLAELHLADLDLPRALLSTLVQTVAGPCVERLERTPGVHYVLIVPLRNGTVLTVGVGPRTRLLPPDRVARFLRGDPGIEPPYTIALSPLADANMPAAMGSLEWRRAGWSARGERDIELPEGVRHVHLGVSLQSPWALLVRGVLVAGFDVVLLAGVWLVGLLIARGWRVPVPAIITTLRTSYRAQLTTVLAAFFVLPVLAFAAWSATRLADEARRAGDLLIRQTVRDAASGAEVIAQGPPDDVRPSIVELGRRLDAELWLYRRGVLVATSSPVLAELGLVDPFLNPDAFRMMLADNLELTMDATTAGRPTRVGYRMVAAEPRGDQVVLAVPQLLNDEMVREQQRDVALALVLGTLAGLAAAIYLAGLAARRLAEPVAALREAALAVGRGSEPPAFPAGTPREFEPVFSAFDRMVTDVRRSQAALEEARSRTARVLANVATGVIAVDDALRVTMANPRASELVLGGTETFSPGEVLPQATPAGWTPVWRAVAAFISENRDVIQEREFDVGGRQIRVQLALLGTAPDGCVIALDDATALTRAARVLAWGEMARQVAHEIKNPLTPIRLGIQHLQRVRGKAQSPAFAATLDETAGRILAEIDRLDGIARAFSRFGAPQSGEQLPLEPVDLAATAREVVQLYELGSPTRFEVIASNGIPALARKDEVKEVLVNLLENARDADAKRVTVQVAASGRQLTVADDGRGIPPELLARVFEPTFSTTSSGAGLGLAIARRLVESWGGLITLDSEPGKGTRVTLTLQTAPPNPAG
ncbi:MAG TPA: ATP-binding protein [Gemmatimonadales bacterium]|nr:ATP-binding protein [Gemmatimonadales bacterium]